MKVKRDVLILVVKDIEGMLVKLRGGTSELTIETGRWCGLTRDEGICKKSNAGEVENADHFLLHCI